jgi:hypothetical protein
MSAKSERIKRHQWSFLTNYLRANGISYSEYLKTPHWKDVRKRYWNCKLHRRTCYACGSNDNLQVHHKSYRRIGNEHLNDLCLLCDNCHRETHRIERERPGGILFGAAKRLRKNLLAGASDGNTRRGKTSPENKT